MLNGNAFNWQSKKQVLTALCAADAEYIAISGSCKEINWLRLFTAAIHFGKESATKLYVDDQPAKHREIRHHFIKECDKRGFIQPEHIPAEENLADSFTKPLDRKKFELWRDRICVRLIDTNPKEE